MSAKFLWAEDDVEWSPPQTQEAFDYDEDKHPRDSHGRWADIAAVGDEPKPNLSAKTHAERVRIAEEVAKELKYPVGGIRVENRVGSIHEVNGQKGREAGYYDPKTGEIVILANAYIAPGPGWNAKDAEMMFRGTVAHEINHAKFDAVIKEYQAENDAGKRGPITAIIGKPLNDFDGLGRSDGVTDYSRSYWERVYAGMDKKFDPENVRAAVRETLAEISNVYYMAKPGEKVLGETTPVRRVRLMAELDPSWRRLYVATLKAYRLTKKGRGA